VPARRQDRRASARTRSGRCALSGPAIAMHKHTAQPPACSAVLGTADGAQSS
jgi:hypothetical protein